MANNHGTFLHRTPEQREARLRHKLVNNEMNPVMDAILTVVLLCVTPLIGMFAMIHDKLMFKFLNKTYIYNVSWEVNGVVRSFLLFRTLFSNCFSLLIMSFGYFNRIPVWIIECLI